LLIAAVALLAHARYGALLQYSFSIRPWWENLTLQIQSVIYLISRLFVLNGMNIDPELTAALPPDVALVSGAIGLAALTALGVAALRPFPWLAFGILWFLLHLLPTNSVIPRLDLVNDRQAYLPMAGAALAVGGAGRSLLQSCRPWLGRSATALFMIVLALFTFLRNRDYRSEIALWEDAARKSPCKARVHNNLGYAYFLAGRHGPARDEYLAALRLDPGYRLAMNNLIGNEEALIGRIHRLGGQAIMPYPTGRVTLSPVETGRVR
jgi:tetratricopeptide (TPR) repeat protein